MLFHLSQERRKLRFAGLMNFNRAGWQKLFERLGSHSLAI